MEEQDELLLESRREKEREFRAESELHNQGQCPLSKNVKITLERRATEKVLRSS